MAWNFVELRMIRNRVCSFTALATTLLHQLSMHTWDLLCHRNVFCALGQEETKSEYKVALKVFQGN